MFTTSPDFKWTPTVEAEIKFNGGSFGVFKLSQFSLNAISFEKLQIH